MRRADHGHQRQRHRLAIDDELRIEYLVAAMFGIGLREHHQLNIRGIPSQLAKRLHQIIDLAARERQAPLLIGARQRLAAMLAQNDLAQAARRGCVKQTSGLERIGPDRFGHAIVQMRRQLEQIRAAERRSGFDEIHGAALDTRHGAQAADMHDVGGLAGPGRLRTDARGHQ